MTFQQNPSSELSDDIVYFTARSTFLASMQLVSSVERFIPNYKCDIHNIPVAVIGGPDSYVCAHLTPTLALYKIPQLTYGSAPVLDNNVQGAFIHQMFPDDTHQYMGILHLLHYFNWTWVGVLYFDDENGQTFVQNVLPIFSEKGICFDFIKGFLKEDYSSRIVNLLAEGIKMYEIVMNSTASVFVVHGNIQTLLIIGIFLQVSKFEDTPTKAERKLLILTAQVDFTEHPLQRFWSINYLHGAISVAVHSKEVLGFQKFLQTRNLISEKDLFFRMFWENAFLCYLANVTSYWNFEKLCTGEEKLESLPSSVFEMSMTAHSYNIYNAVFAVAHALQSMESSQSKKRVLVKGQNCEILSQLPWQLHHFVKYVSFNNSAGEKISFDQNGTLEAGFDIINWITFPNKSFIRIKVGTVNPHAPQGNVFTISENDIMWPNSFNQVRPFSVCNDNCPAGFSKRKKEGKPFCCYECIPCHEGMISNETDMDACFECPEGQYPNNGQHGCIPKYIIFLSFDEPLGVTLAILSLSFALLTALVLGIFIKYKDTAIVKANNRSLSYVLLISLLLSFSCAFLFMGQPDDVTCFLRQSAFGFTFTVALSCVLAKTITVVLAFKATQPGSKMREWVGKPLANSIVLSCSFIQAIIYVVCLIRSPPFPEIDKHSMVKEIVLDCSQGSPLRFYSVFSFISFLTIVSFIMAFLARKLPDIFNEAKFITFSMLAFCSVWITFIPTYLSTKGKYASAVEVFSILASAAGLLIFIFSPKVYIVLLKPELNNKEQLIRTKCPRKSPKNGQNAH
ncbi:vomeronasal type-2 receptor 26-like [Sceloporus undulatus]|uniref:vomeronasal type-2 receptor 26-like n=1 Tax=Sceloporus undulatus TaxID=8520 RepID=UPI001C4C0815|nr:vomeronasal type-2 receptor 26-like [Sceloporus undulatus]